jgi:hypothetical protein
LPIFDCRLPIGPYQYLNDHSEKEQSTKQQALSSNRQLAIDNRQ